jgi:Zn-dependent protease
MRTHCWRGLYHPHFPRLQVRQSDAHFPGGIILNMLSLEPLEIASLLITLVLSLTIHEFAHAWTADQFGDDTPRLAGRLTLNPLAHLDLWGSLMFVIAGFGWAKPVPVDYFALRRRTPAALMLVALAGPFSNLLLAILASLPFRMGLLFSGSIGPETTSIIATFLLLFIFYNLLLLFFNLLPIFPLDGEKIAAYFLPQGGQDVLYRLRPYGPMILIGIILIGNATGFDLFDLVVGAPAEVIFRHLVLSV